MESQSGKMVVTVCAGPFIREAVLDTARPITSEDLRLFSLYLEPSFEWLNELSTQAAECSGQMKAREGHRDLSDCPSVLSGSTLTPESNDERWRKQRIAQGAPTGLWCTKGSKQSTGERYAV